MSSPGIYVASPLGFSAPGARFLNDVLHPALEAAGFQVLDPWASGRQLLAALPATTDEETANARLGAANAQMIEASAGMLAVLDGPDVDSGTAAEIGYAAGIGRLVIGFRSDLRMAGDNLSAPVNLQVLHFISASGGAYTTRLADAIDVLRSHFFERLEHARIYHLALRTTWEAAKRDGAYRSSTRDQTLEEVGFIHCSFVEQLLPSAERFYADAAPEELVVLVIDPERLSVPLLTEMAGNGARFPHIYGELNPDAVVATISLHQEAGVFALTEPGPA